MQGIALNVQDVAYVGRNWKHSKSKPIDCVSQLHGLLVDRCVSLIRKILIIFRSAGTQFDFKEAHQPLSQW